ncbi:MAG: HEAT repeat domain-containing protein [Elusimicrobia bacterium]|nr:HEAT repeat domain-containing protein [Elusimicrobiota bacterium]
MRDAALEEIRTQESARARDSAVLRRAAYARDAVTRTAAFRAMGRIQSPAYARTLSVGLYDRDPAAREEAVFALGQLAMAESLGDNERSKIATSLAGLSRKAPASLRPRVVEAWGKAGGPASERSLSGLLKDKDPAVRGEAALALFRLKFLKRIREHSPATVEALTGAFTDPDPGVRWRAVHAFSRGLEPRALEALAKAAADEDAWTRFFAVKALGHLGGSPDRRSGPVGAGVDALVKAAKDLSPWVRAEAARALGAAGNAGLLEPALFADDSAHVRAAAVEAVGASGEPELAGRLTPLLSEGSPLARAAAVEALAKLVKDAAVPVLVRETTHPHWWVRSRAYLALEGLSGAEALLKGGLKDADARVAAAALESVAKSSAAFTDADLAAVLRDPKTPLEVLGAAVDAAAERKSSFFIEPLRAAMKNPQTEEFEELRNHVLETLEVIDRAHPEGLRASSDRRPAQRSRRPRSFGPAPDEAVVIVETEKGDIEVTLAGREAPTHVASFLALASSGVYNGTVWHRVVSGFVIQGGDPRGSGWGDAGFTLPDEIGPPRFDRGTVGMPNAGKDTGGCQLFVTHVPAPHLDGRYTAFGRVTRGMEVVDRIEPGDRIVRVYLKSP